MSNIDIENKIELCHWSNLSKIQNRNYLIKGLLDKIGVSLIYGPSNSGKTFLALDLAAYISLNMQWSNQKTNGGKVVYVAAEGGFGISNRLKAFEMHHKLEDCGDMYILPRPLKLCGEKAETKLFINTLNEFQDIGLIIIDTLSRCFDGEENGSKDMSDFIRNIDLIKNTINAHVLIIHHTGKDASKGARGHSALRAAVDTEVEVKNKNGTITAIVTKQRDGKTGSSYSFDLKVYEVDEDEDGDSIKSCALVCAEKQPDGVRLTGRVKRAYDILVNQLAEYAELKKLKPDMPKVKTMSLSLYRKALQHENLCASDKEDSRNKAVYRAIESLHQKGIARSYGDYIWLTDHNK